VRPLSCAKLSVGSVLRFPCWKRKPYPKLYSGVQIALSIILYTRSLLLAESSDLRPSNQYILLRAIPGCFRFEENVFMAVFGRGDTNASYHGILK
jgi:hypothetical protein